MEQSTYEQRYQLLRPLGKGGAGEVYLVRDKATGKEYALKKLYDKRMKKRAGEAAELTLLHRFHHPAFPHILEVSVCGQNSYVLMDYVEGISLEQCGPVSVQQVTEWASQLCRALIYLHSQKPPLIYRDLKPENIILQKDGRLKLIDFGTVIQKDSRYRNDCMGTRGYAAPEQYRRGGRIDKSTDIYCLGMTLYKLLYGHLPNERERRYLSLLRRRPGAAVKIDKILAKCLSEHRFFRYHSCKKILKDLQRLSEKGL